MNPFAARLPRSVRLVEVGPRDGLQNETQVVPTATKVELIDRLTATGLRAIEATSFVRADRIPQLADGAEVYARIDKHPDVAYPVLVPNEKGMQSALAAGAAEVAVFTAASDEFNRRNVNASIAESIARFVPVMALAKQHGVRVRGYVSCVLGCPYQGAVDPNAVDAVVRELVAMGCYEVSLGDTIGVGTPGHVTALLDAFNAAGLADDVLAMHFHDTYGQALSNALTALRHGVTTFDASAGGLGGCPYAKSATGNLATEDLVWMLNGLGVETGVDLETLVATSTWMAQQLGRPSPSAVVRALGDA